MSTKRGIYIEFIGDEIKYVRSAENVMSTNTKLGSSFRQVAVSATKSAEIQVSTAVAANRALREQALNLRTIAATSTGEKRAAATQLAVQAERQLATATGVSTRATSRFSQETRTAERDFGKLSRGALAGAGVFSGLGRSLAFASGGFLIFATGATLIRRSVDAATALAATQRSVNTQLKTSGKSWGEYGAQVNAVDQRLSHVSGFTNQELLQSFGYLVRVSGNVSTALKLSGVAADVARGRNISLSSATLALGKALGGSITALRRLGIVVPKNVKGMEALNYVAAKFAGQARASTTFQERFNATMVNSEEIIGTALLPTIQRLATEFGNWLAKMNETGRLQKDVNTILHDSGVVIHTVTGLIQTLDKVTGGFVKTLKLIVEIKFASMVVGWITNLQKLALSWVAVEGAANAAATAETRALGAGAAGVGGGVAAGEAGVAGGAVLGGGVGGIYRRYRVRRSGLAARVGQYTAPDEIGAAATRAEAKVASLRGTLLGLGALQIAPIVIPVLVEVTNRVRPGGGVGRTIFDLNTYRAFDPRTVLNAASGGKAGDFFSLTGKLFSGESIGRALRDINAKAAADQQKADLAAARQQFGYLFNLKQTGGIPSFLQPAGPLGRAATGQPSPYPFGVPPIPVYTQYTVPLRLQIGQAKSGLTQTLADDTKVAREIIANIKRLIDFGHIRPGTKGYLSALQAWASAQSTLDSAEQQAAQKRQAAAAKAKQIASSYTTPIDLQIADVQAQMTKSLADDKRVAREIIAAARAALASGKKNKQGRLAALQTILSAQQALQQVAASYALPQALQLGFARAQAFGGDTRKWLLRMKAAALKAYKAAKGNVDLQLQILNEITSINGQLASGLNDAMAALGLFKQANLKKLTAGLGLTAEQRAALQARLSQLGPGRSTPGQGIGAAGYAINPDTGRPIVIHHTTRLDGKVIAQSTTTHQQRTRSRNPRQSRGPNAGMAAA